MVHLQMIGENPQFFIFIIVFCRYKIGSCYISIKLPRYLCIFIFFYRFFIEYKHKCWLWTQLLIIRFFYFFACVAFFGAMTELAKCAESCLHFCCLCLQSHSYAMHGSYGANKTCNCVTALYTAIDFNQLSTNCLAVDFELA